MVTITDNGVTVEAETLAKAKRALAKAQVAAKTAYREREVNSSMAYTMAYSVLGSLAHGAVGYPWVPPVDQQARMVRMDDRGFFVLTLDGCRPEDRGEFGMYGESFSSVRIVCQPTGQAIFIQAERKDGKFELYAVGVWFDRVALVEIPCVLLPLVEKAIAAELAR
jgi:hypothetical protein